MKVANTFHLDRLPYFTLNRHAKYNNRTKMISKLCGICQSIGQGEQMLRKDQPHHGSADGLLAAANEGCCICREIIKSPAWKDLDPVARATFSATWYLVPLEKPFAGWFKLSIESSTIMEDDDPRMNENGDSQSFNSPDSPIWGFFLQPANRESTTGAPTSTRTNPNMSFDYLRNRTLPRCSLRPARQVSRPRDVQFSQPLVLCLLV